MSEDEKTGIESIFTDGLCASVVYDMAVLKNVTSWDAETLWTQNS